MRKILLSLLLFVVVVFLIGCGEVTLSKIEMDIDGSKIEIDIDEFDLSNYNLIAFFDDKTTKEIVLQEAMLTEADLAKLSTEGTHTITIKYLGETTTLTVTLFKFVVVTFDANGGTLVGTNTVKVKKGSKLSSLPSATKTNLNLIGWKTSNGSIFDINSTITEDITLIADWNDVANIEVKTNPGEAALDTLKLSDIKIKVNYEDATSTEVALTKEMLSNADFTKLSTEGTHTVKVSYLGKTVDLTITIYKNVVITFNPNGGELEGLNTVTIRKGTKLTILPTVTKTNFNFIAWKTADGSIFDINTTITDNITLIADWNDITSIEVESNPGEAALDDLKLSDIKIKVNYEDATSTEVALTKEMLSNADFTKLSTEGTHTVKVSYLGKTVDFTITIYKNVVITFNPEGGELEGEDTVTIRKGTKLTTLPTASLENYDFIGWKMADGSIFTTDIIVNGDITLTAYFEMIPEDERSTINYYTIADLKVDKIVKGVVITTDGGVYIPTINEYVIEKDSKNVRAIYRDFFYGSPELPLEKNEKIIDVLVLDMYQFVFKTDKGNYIGSFFNNKYGQYGLGHNNELNESPVHKIFQNINLLDGEEIVTIKANDKFNIAITNNNRVFFTGTLLYNNEKIKEALTPIEITDDFALASGEYFLSYEEETTTFGVYNSEVIHTNKRVFGFSKIFSPEVSTIYTDISIYQGETVKLVNTYIETGIFYLVTERGKYSFSLGAGAVVSELELSANEKISYITEINVGYSHVLYIVTSSGRIIFVSIDEDFDISIEDITKVLPDELASVKSIYIENSFNQFIKVKIFFITDQDKIYYSYFETVNGKLVIYEISNNLPSDFEILVDISVFSMNIYFQSGNNIYHVNGDLVDTLTVPIEKIISKNYRKGEVVLKNYESEKYLVNGWVNSSGDLYESTITLESDINLYIDLKQFMNVQINVNDQYSCYIELITGDALTLELILENIDLPYGYMVDINNILDKNDNLYELGTKLYGSNQYFNITLLELEKPIVQVTYLDKDGNIIGYDNLIVVNGDTLRETRIKYNHAYKYKIVNYYTDSELTNLFDLDTVIEENMNIYILLTENDEITVTIIMPEAIDNISFNLYIGQPFIDYYMFIDLIGEHEEYYFNSLYLDQNFNNWFNANEFVALVDITLYAEMTFLTEYSIKFYLEGVELEGIRIVDRINGDYHIEDYIKDHIYFNYIIQGIYNDINRTKEAIYFNHSQDGNIYVFVNIREKYEINIIFVDYPELGFVYSNYNIDQNEIHEAIDKVIYERMLNHYPFKIFADKDAINPIEKDFSAYESLYIKLDSNNYSKITIYLDEDNLNSIVFYPGKGKYFEASFVYNYLRNIDNYVYSNLLLFTDSSRTNKFAGLGTYEDLILYATFDKTEKYKLIINIQNGPILEIYYEGGNIDFEKEIHSRLRDLGYNNLVKEFELYLDENYESNYDQENQITSDLELYYVIVAPEEVNITIEFVNYDLDSLELTRIKGYKFDWSKIFSYIYTNIDAYNDIYFSLFTDSNLTIEFDERQPINEDITLYMKFNNSIKLVFPYTDIPELLIFLDNSNKLNLSELKDIISDYYYYYYDYNYEISDLNVYFDLEMTNKYKGEVLEDGSYIFISFVKEKTYYLEVSFINDRIAGYYERLYVKALSVEEVYELVDSLLEEYNRNNTKFIIKGIYIDKNQEFLLEDMITKDTRIYVSVEEIEIVNIHFQIFSDLYHIELVKGDSLSLEDFLSVIDMPYGYMVDIVTFEGKNFVFDTPLFKDCHVQVILKKVDTLVVFVHYYDENKNFIGYDNVMIVKGGTLGDDGIEFNHGHEYKIHAFYNSEDFTTLFGLDTLITESITIHIILTENDKVTINFIMPYPLENKKVELHVGASFLNFDDFIYLIGLPGDYIFRDLFFDVDFNDLFDYYNDPVLKDLTLYVLVYQAKEYKIRFFLDDIELSVLNTTIKAYEDEPIEWYVYQIYPNIYQMDAIYGNIKKTKEVFYFYDLNSDTIYVDLFEKEHREIEFVFPQIHELESIFIKYYISYQYELNNIIEETLSNHVIYSNGFDLYSNIELTSGVYTGYEDYDILYVKVRGPELVNITLHIDDIGLGSINSYSINGYMLNIYKIEDYLKDIIKDYSVCSIGIFTDEERLTLYKDAIIEENLELYISLESSSRSTITINITEYLSFDIFIDKDGGSYLNEMIKTKLLDMSLYHYLDKNLELYIDEEYQDLYNEELLIDGMIIYAKFENNQSINLVFKFPNQDLDSIFIQIPKGTKLIEIEYRDKIMDHLSDYFGNLSNIMLFSDEDLYDEFDITQELYNDLTIYVLLDPIIKLVVPFVDIPVISIFIESIDFLIEDITYILNYYYYYYDFEISDLKFYLDSEKLIEYTNQSLEGVKYIYASFDLEEIYKVRINYFVYNDGSIHHSVTTTKSNLFEKVTNLINEYYIDYYNDYSGVKVNQLYLDEDRSIPYDGELGDFTEIYVDYEMLT